MKTAELSGALLDYWVARAEGIEHPRALRKMAPDFIMVPYKSEDEEGPITRYRTFNPSEDWSQGGPIIERERPTLEPGLHYGRGNTWKGWIRNESGFHHAYGQTALVAAMRAYVASKFGDEVPDEVTA
jgi:Protein of unknown function (DUF2591)